MILVNEESVPDGPGGECCGGCRYFVREYRAKHQLSEPPSEQGQCRFNPPVVMADFSEPWPKVHESSWCGKYNPHRGVT